jgi:hypothetical protein
MITREAVSSFAPPRNLSLQSPPNWTAVVFFACLSGLHFAIALPAFYHGRWEGYLSLVFATGFATVSVACYFARYEMAILPREQRICLRNSLGPVRFERFVDFSEVHAVRLTLCGVGKSSESRIEVLCDNEDIDCPPTDIPRQQALFLAILMGVQLIKVTTMDTPPEASDRFV